MQQPQNKDEMIQFLLMRLQAAEEAISTSELIVRHERDYRKQMA